MLLRPETLAAFRRRGIPVYCFYPDVSFGAHGSNIAQCLPHYDCIFTTKEFHLRDEKLRGHVRDMQLVQHGFDPEVHRPLQVSDKVKKFYGSDVSFVGCWSLKKERLVKAIIAGVPQAKVRLWGPGWNRADEGIRQCWAGRGAYGDEMAIIYQCSKINLGLLSEAAADTISGDQTTVRTWQIPAAGGFLLHEDTAELKQFLKPGKEVATFANENDLPRQVEHYLAHSEERMSIAAAGKQRCLGGQYTYVAAAETICGYHATRKTP
jgi:spore maturation protein CgeB